MISFYTKSQHFTFIDDSPPYSHSVLPTALQAGVHYRIVLTLKNDSTHTAHGVRVRVSHSAVGIGYIAGTEGLSQPAPVTVPPAERENAETPGLANVEYTFVPPPGGHGCLYATLESATDAPVDAAHGISNNFDVQGAYVGQANKYSFMVFGSPTQIMNMDLRIVEQAKPQPGGRVLPSWGPTLLIPDATGHLVPSPAPRSVTLAANTAYLMGLSVTPPTDATDVRHFSVSGWNGTTLLGEVVFEVSPMPAQAHPPPPDVFITGGYESNDIFLIDSVTGATIPIDQSDKLKPNTNYRFQAQVSNASDSAAKRVVVRFWAIPGGAGKVGGRLLDTQVISLGAHEVKTIQSAAPFHTGAPRSYLCAAVSLTCLDDPGCAVDPVRSEQIPSPIANPAHSPSAWRNTATIFVKPGKSFDLPIEVNHDWSPGDPVEAHVDFEIEARLVRRDWANQPEIVALASHLSHLATRSKRPLYLLPDLRKNLPAADLKVQMKLGENAAGNTKLGALERRADGHLLSRVEMPASRNQYTAPLVLTGQVPEDAQPGDLYLVTFTAKYPESKVAPAKSVQFTAFVRVE